MISITYKYKDTIMESDGLYNIRSHTVSLSLLHTYSTLNEWLTHSCKKPTDSVSHVSTS